MNLDSIRKRFAREAVKSVLSPMLRWAPLRTPRDGFSIVLGVPWDLRHLLHVNLRFVAATDLSRLAKVHVIFDRRHRPEMDRIEEATRKAFPSLPLEFHRYPPAAGWLIERVNVSTFYNSMNVTQAIAKVDTRYAVTHDFDLYPLRADHFTSIVDAMASNGWRFSGHELTNFDGLRDADLQLGTWTLGIDVEWLRRTHRPIDCFHRVAEHRGKVFNLDPFAWIQFRTPERGLVPGADPSRFCHVKNLCSTYLRFLKRAPLNVAWRMHYLWYLESLSGIEGRLTQVEKAMQEATGAVLSVDRLPADFAGVHVTCANVLRDELMSMERAIFGSPRVEAIRYVDGFERFLRRVGSCEPIVDADGTVRWSPEAAMARGEGAA